MAAAYFEAGKTHEKATFEFSMRRLPPHRTFVLAVGLQQAIDYLLNLSFTDEEVAYLRGLPQFRQASPEFFDYLRSFRFTGDVFAVPEGTPLFPGEPFLTIRAPIIEAQIPETYLLAALSFQSLVATKAARCVEAAQGRDIVEFGTRRAHTAEAGILAGRAAYIGGCAGTSNALAGFRYEIPVMGTAAHSWVMSFSTETEAFRQLQKVLGPSTIQLVDTYDTLEGTRKAASLGQPLLGIRLDSGDLFALSRSARAILDEAGLTTTKIMVSGDLDEYRIEQLIRDGAPIDSFGVGTQLSTSADAPNLSAVYKMVELEISGIKRFTAKLSEDKQTVPGAKQVFRYAERDVLARSGECGSGEALLRPVVLSGQLIEPLPDPHAARSNALRNLGQLPSSLRRLDSTEVWPIKMSRELSELAERTRRNLDVTART